MVSHLQAFLLTAAQLTGLSTDYWLLATGYLLLTGRNAFNCLPDLARGGQGFNRRDDHLAGARFLAFILRLGFEKLRVRQDDAELVVQRVKQLTQLGRVGTHFCASKGVVKVPSNAGSCACGSRHRESTKIRTDPPAVRTYSTLPAVIQL